MFDWFAIVSLFNIHKLFGSFSFLLAQKPCSSRVKTFQTLYIFRFFCIYTHTHTSNFIKFSLFIEFKSNRHNDMFCQKFAFCISNLFDHQNGRSNVIQKKEFFSNATISLGYAKRLWSNIYESFFFASWNSELFRLTILSCPVDHNRNCL